MNHQAHLQAQQDVADSARANDPASFLRSVAVVLGGSAGAQAAALVAVPFLTRLYRPEDFGVLSIFVSVVSLALPVLCLRYDLAISMAASPQERSAVVRVAIAAACATTALTLGVLWVVVRMGGFGSSVGALLPHTGLLAISLLAAGLNQTFTAYSVATCRFAKVAHSRVYQSFGQIATQILGGVVRLGAFGLLAGDAVGRLSSSLPLARASLAEDETGERVSIRAAAKRFASFSGVSSVSAALNGVGLYLPALGFAAVFGTSAGGWFALSQRVTAIPMGLLGAAVAQVYLGHAGQLVKSDVRRCRALYLSVRGRLLRLGIAASIAMVVGAYGFELVFGENWAEAGVYCQLLAPGLAAQFVGSPLSQTLTLLGHLRVQALLDTARALLVVLILIAVPVLGASPRLAVASLSGVSVLHYGALLFVTDRALARATSEQSSLGAE